MSITREQFEKAREVVMAHERDRKLREAAPEMLALLRRVDAEVGEVHDGKEALRAVGAFLERFPE